MITVDNIISRFNPDEPILLTQEEELVLLNAILDQAHINCGTSRAVYAYNDDFVIKVGLSEEGQAQNDIEYDYYKRLGNEYFAYLYAHGKFINVMERVSDCFYWEDYDDGEDGENDFEGIVEAINDLTDYDGGDNGQLGWSDNRGEWVCYDYGYSMDWDREDIVGDMDYWIYKLDIVQMAIDGLIEDRTYSYRELSELCDDAEYIDEEDYRDEDEDEYDNDEDVNDSPYDGGEEQEQNYYC